MITNYFTNGMNTRNEHNIEIKLNSPRAMLERLSLLGAQLKSLACGNQLGVKHKYARPV